MPGFRGRLGHQDQAQSGDYQAHWDGKSQRSLSHSATPRGKE